jgi:hypothetical protein
MHHVRINITRIVFALAFFLALAEVAHSGDASPGDVADDASKKAFLSADDFFKLGLLLTDGASHASRSVDESHGVQPSQQRARISQ